VVDEPADPLWRNRDFVLLWSGQAISTLGTRFSSLALPLVALAVTRSPGQAGFIGALSFLPYLAFGLPAGALIDRWDRKRTMTLCDLARCIAFGSVPLTVALGRLTMPQLYLVALVDGTSFVLFNTAQAAALPQVVQRGQLPRVTSWNETAGTAATLVGPALSGAIIGLARTTIIGAAVAYLLDSVSYLVSALSLTLIRTPFQATRDGEAGNATRRSLRAEIGEGLRFLWRHPQLRLVALLSTAITVCESPLYLAIILLARRELHAGAQTIGLIISVAGLGGLAGALLAPHLAGRLHKYGIARSLPRHHPHALRRHRRPHELWWWGQHRQWATRLDAVPAPVVPVAPAHRSAAWRRHARAIALDRARSGAALHER